MKQNNEELITLLNAISFVANRLARHDSSKPYEKIAARAKFIADYKQKNIDDYAMLVSMYNHELLTADEFTLLLSML